MNFTRPAVSAAAKKVLQQLSAGLNVPDVALNLDMLQHIVDQCSADEDPCSAVPIECPFAIMKTVAKSSRAPIGKAKLKWLKLRDTDLQAMLPKRTKMNKRAVVTKAQGLAQLLLHHDITDDAVKFVLSVHKLVPPDESINWNMWLRAPDPARRPPLWWRVFMVIVEAKAVDGERYYLQMTRSVGKAEHFVQVMNTKAFKDRAPNLDIWTWDTATALKILRTYLFTENINEIAQKAANKVRNRLNHFDVDMDFSEGFSCIDELLECLQKKNARERLKLFHDNVRTWFPAFSQHDQMEQARSRPLFLTERQYAEFQRYVLDHEGHILKICRLQFQSGASSGKTVIAILLAVEFLLDKMSIEGDFPEQDNMRVLFLTHAPILAYRSAKDLCDQLKLKLKLFSQDNNNDKAKNLSKTVTFRRSDESDDCNVFYISVGGKHDAIVVATINSAIDYLQDKVFLAGVIVDECHVVYGRADKCTDQNVGQCRLPAKEIAPIVEKWGGAQSPGEGEEAKRLVLFGDERNQCMRRRFTDTGNGVEACAGCKTQRLSCWMSKEFDRSFYSRVERLFELADQDGDGKLSIDELRSFLEKTKESDNKLKRSYIDKNSILIGEMEEYSNYIRNTLSTNNSWGEVLTKLGTTVERGVDTEALCLLYHDKNGEKLDCHELLFGLDGKPESQNNLCVNCAFVAKAYGKGATTQEIFLGHQEDPIFPQNMRFVARGLLDNNYRQPAKIADMASAQHGGQKGDLLVHHVDGDSVDGRDIHYVDVKPFVDVKQKILRLLSGANKLTMQDLSVDVCNWYSDAVAKELSEVCARIKETKTDSLDHPEVLVLAPRCHDDPGFLKRLEQGCVRGNKKIQRLVENGQIRFGGVAEWTGCSCPVVVLTGFHQPYHLLTNIGCVGRERVLAASRAEMTRAKTLVDRLISCGWPEFFLVDEKAMRDRQEEGHKHLEARLRKVPLDTMLYVAITRCTWGLSVVEPDPRRFVQHYVIGGEARRLSRLGKKITVHSSLSKATAGEAENEKGVFNSRTLHNAQVLLDNKTDRKPTDLHLDMSGKDLSLVPQCVLDKDDNTASVDLSVNQLQRLPTELWKLSLQKLNLSHNHRLGCLLLSVLAGAAQCIHLRSLWLRDVVAETGVFCQNRRCRQNLCCLSAYCSLLLCCDISTNHHLDLLFQVYPPYNHRKHGMYFHTAMRSDQSSQEP